MHYISIFAIHLYFVMLSENMDSDMEDMFDFSELPDVVWVQVLSYLPLEDRYHVSQCCKLLYDHFTHPSLWLSIKMILLGDLNKYEWENFSGVVLPQKYVHMIEKFGKYFKDLTLIYNGYLTILPAHCAKVLTALAKTCRLETLTLQVGGMITKDDFHLRKARESDMKSFCELVTQAYRLKSFNLKSWPMYPGMTTANILVDLMGNPKLKELEELKLYWQNASSGTWATQNAVLPTFEETLDVVTHFTQLSVLCLRSPMMSEEMIVELASPHRVPLQRLGILVCFSRHDPHRRGQIPQISCEAWKALTTHSCDLVVDVTVVNRVPYVYLCSLLLPEVPVFSINFMRYARCDQEDVLSLVDKYSKTLRKYVNYSDSTTMDDALLHMTTQCIHLDYLVYYGTIHQDTVLRLAKLRGRQWYRFEVFGDTIATNPLVPFEDDDAIIRRDTDGDFYIHRPVVMYLTGDEKEDCLTALSRQVGEILQQKWAPTGKENIKKLLEEERLTKCEVVSPKMMAAASRQAAGDDL